MRSGKRIFTPAEIGAIRAQWDAGTCDVKGWAQAKGCVPETIRKIGRRETYLEVEAPASEPDIDDVAASLRRLQQEANKLADPKPDAGQLLGEMKGTQT